MTELTKEQTTFLAKHNTAVGSVFDATGLGKNDYRKLMKDLGKTVAIGVTPCKKGNHAMRTRSGHCIQCNPASLAFQKRHSMNGYVYIAGSLELSVIKVGLASDVEERMKSLNRLNYAGASDWKCVFWVKTPKAGKVEFDTHANLVEYAAPKVYQRGGRDVHCLETFSCSASIGLLAIRENLEEKGEEWEDKNLVESYCFESNTGESFNRSRKGSEVQGAKPICRSKVFDLEANSGRNAVSDKDSSLSCTARDESVKNVVESKKIQDTSLARTSYRKLFVLGVMAFLVLIYLVNL